MHMLYDSDSFVVVHMLAEVQAPRQAGEPANAPVRGIVLAEDQQASTDKLPQPQYQLARNGFEIVDKRSGKEVYLDGSWAELFQQQITAWQVKTPTQDEVEETLECYAQLAQNPVVMH